MSYNTLVWFIRWCGSIYYYLVLVSVCVCGTGPNQFDYDIHYKDQITIYAVTPPNEPHRYILTHFNNCNFSNVQIVCSLTMVFFTPKHVGGFYANFNANLKLFLRLSNCASVGEKTILTKISLNFISIHLCIACCGFCC